MTNTDLGACEPFIYELRRSNLIERGQLDQVLEDFLRRNPRAEPNSLADHLISQGILTRFQADRVIAGKTQGLVLGPYVLSDAVGSGSMGTVHKAQSKNDGNNYAVKVLPRRSMWNVRLARRQVRSFGAFSHPTVVPFVDVGTSGGLHYLVWSFAQGEPLEGLVQRAGRLDYGSAAFVIWQVASGLALAHQNGLFHGLIKPSNVMITPDGQIRILDFGIGSLLAENEGESLVDTMSTANTLTSGLDCSSPESIMEPTNRTPAGDQYSLGCVLYHCLTGRYPFPDGSAVEKMMAHQFKQPASVKELAPETPDELVAVLEKLMQKKPEDRFHGADDVAEALSHVAPRTAPALLLNGSAPQASAANSKKGLSGVRPMVMPPPAAQAPSRPSATGLPTRHSDQGVTSPAASASGYSMPSTPLPAPMPPPAASMPSYMPVSATSSSINLPSRQSFRNQPMPMPRPMPTASMVNIQVPMPADIYQLDPAPQPPPSGRAAAQQQWATAADDDRGPVASMGPLGFIAIGAAVAVACFLVVHNLLK